MSYNTQIYTISILLHKHLNEDLLPTRKYKNVRRYFAI